MFETVEVGNTLDPETYHRDLAALRGNLLAAQKELAKADFSVVVVFSGVEGAGKTEMANHLLEWMDPHGIRVHALGDLTDEERERPPMWRFWRLLPPWRRMSIFLNSWYGDPLDNAFRGRIDETDFDQTLSEIADFERMLFHEGVLLIKFWLHLSHEAQKKRFKELRSDKLQRWRVTKHDLKLCKRYGQFRALAERMLQATETVEAPWTLVESAEAHFRNFQVGSHLLERLRERLVQAKPASPPDEADTVIIAPRPALVFNNLDMSLKLDQETYKDKLAKYQARLGFLARKLYRRRRSMVLALEGPDAAGKGGSIRRLTEAMDARDYQVTAIAAPSDDERAHPYLWRFWLQLPRLGRVSLFDRSWYGRVLVERVEGFTKRPDWFRAYSEINSFEKQLTDFGMIVLKFWLAVSPEEQLRRFQNREETPYKQYKLTEEDWRNRAKWDHYQRAASDMVEKTSCDRAPWILVEADNKEWARIKILHTVVERLEEEF